VLARYPRHSRRGSKSFQPLTHLAGTPRGPRLREPHRPGIGRPW
jgi:hypothetical protein